MLAPNPLSCLVSPPAALEGHVPSSKLSPKHRPRGGTAPGRRAAHRPASQDSSGHLHCALAGVGTILSHYWTSRTSQMAPRLRSFQCRAAPAVSPFRYLPVSWLLSPSQPAGHAHPLPLPAPGCPELTAKRRHRLADASPSLASLFAGNTPGNASYGNVQREKRVTSSAGWC